MPGFEQQLSRVECALGPEQAGAPTADERAGHAGGVMAVRSIARPEPLRRRHLGAAAQQEDRRRAMGRPGSPAAGSLASGGAPSAVRRIPNVLRREPNKFFTLCQQASDEEFLDKAGDHLDRGAPSDADFDRFAQRLDKVAAGPLGETEKRRITRLRSKLTLLRQDYKPNPAGEEVAKQSVAGARPKKAKSDQSRSVYVGNGDDITAYVEQDPGKKDARKQKELDIDKAGTGPDAEDAPKWTWKANVDWLRASAAKFSRFKIVAKLSADEVGLLGKAASGMDFLRLVNETAKEDEAAGALADKAKEAPSGKVGKKEINELRSAGKLSDLWNGEEGRFTYFAEELAMLVDLGFKPQEAKGRVYLVRPEAGVSGGSDGVVSGDKSDKSQTNDVKGGSSDSTPVIESK